MAVIPKSILFDILLGEEFWHRVLSQETMRDFQKVLEDKMCLSFVVLEHDLNRLRNELFRLRQSGLKARVKGGVQFKRFKDSLSYKKFSWNVPIDKHKSVEHVNKLNCAIKDKEEQIKTLEKRFASYVKSENEVQVNLKQKLKSCEQKVRNCETLLSTEEKTRKRKPLSDCSNSYRRKVRKTDDDLIKDTIRGIAIKGCKVLSVIVTRSDGRQDVINMFDKADDSISDSNVDVLNTLIYILDSFRVSQRAYHELSMVFPTLPRSCKVGDIIKKFNESYNITGTPDGKGVQQPFRDTLCRVIEQHLKSNPNVLDDGVVEVKFSGDGTRVGKKISVFNFGFNIVSKGFSNQTSYPLCIARIKENYNEIKQTLEHLLTEIHDLKGREFLVQGRRFSVAAYLGGDYKFLLTAVGISSIAASHVCIYCRCGKADMKDLKKNWSLLDTHLGARCVYSFDEGGRAKGRKKVNTYSITNQPLFGSIDPSHVVIDHLHLFLRITDKLFNLLVSELRTLDNINQQTTFSTLERDKIRHIAALEHVLAQLGINFDLTVNRDTRKLQYRDLQGPEKILFLEKFRASDLIEDTKRAARIQSLWDQFGEINTLLKLDHPCADTVLRKSVAWCELFSQVYQCRDITPYIHNLRYHVHELIRLHGDLIRFSQQGMEKLNDTITKHYFSSSNHKGLRSWQTVMEKQNRIADLSLFQRQKRSYKTKR